MSRTKDYSNRELAKLVPGFSMPRVKCLMGPIEPKRETADEEHERIMVDLKENRGREWNDGLPWGWTEEDEEELYMFLPLEAR